MTLLLWIVRLLVVLALIRMILRLVTTARTPAARPRPASMPRERQGGELVRDPQCGTYVAKSRAVTLGAGDATQYFCSSECRDTFAKVHA